MISNSGMRNAHNDNEPFSFQSIGSVAAELTERLTNERNEKQDDKSTDDRTDAERREHDAAEQQRRYVEYRLRQIEAFERRARGDKRTP